MIPLEIGQWRYIEHLRPAIGKITKVYTDGQSSFADVIRGQYVYHDFSCPIQYRLITIKDILETWHVKDEYTTHSHAKALLKEAIKWCLDRQ